MAATRQVIEVVANFWRLAQLPHDRSPRGAVPAIAAVMEIGEQMRAFVQEDRVAVGHPGRDATARD